MENTNINDYTSSEAFCKTESEYAVKISLTKHEHDHSEKPYYWSLVKCDESWHQVGFGWEESPKKCLSAATEYYHELTSNTEN